jgi:sec-independent protein translocase protein TatA
MGIESPVHLLFIAIVALIVLGPKRLPGLARALGQGIREFRSSLEAGAEPAEPAPPSAPPTHSHKAPPPAEPTVATTSSSSSPEVVEPAAGGSGGREQERESE